MSHGSERNTRTLAVDRALKQSCLEELEELLPPDGQEGGSVEEGEEKGMERGLEEEEEVDPRIQGELEHLHESTDAVNRWEAELEDALTIQTLLCAA
uniref:SH3 domain-binding protein 5 n=1 Tax=Spermophilus dauricus TaxID=99837 RepID=A0A8C9PUK1_SPEDA